MIETASKFGPLLNRTKWFSERPEVADGLRFVRYVQCRGERSCPGFVDHPFQTMVIDLSEDEDAIFGQFSKSTRYKVKRGDREGVVCSFDRSPEAFRTFYAGAVAHQGRRPIAEGQLEAAGDKLCISEAAFEGEPLAMHCTLIDPERGRARLWHSCSRADPADDSEMTNRIGRANRLLHHQDMLHFKALGFGVYDFGGYSADKNDQKKMAINKFKDGFGGDLLVERNYISYPLYLVLQGAQLLAGLRGHGAAARDDG